MLINDKISNIKKNKIWSKLLKNMSIAFIGEIGSTIMLMLTTVCMVWFIGDSGYGEFVLAQTYMTIVDGFINFQSWQAVIKYGSEHIENKEYNLLEKTIKMGMIVDISTAILGMIIALLLVVPLGSIFGWSRQLQICMAIFSIEIVFHFSGTSIGVLRLFNKFNLVAIQKILVASVKLGIVLICGFSSAVHLILIVVVYVIADICGHILLSIMALYEIYKEKHISLRNVFRADLNGYKKKFFGFAFWTNITSAMDIPVKQMDVFLLSMISYDIVAVYKVYKQIGNIFVQLAGPLSQAVLPQFSEYIAQGRNKECYNIMKKIRNMSLLILLPVAIIISVASPWLMGTIFGKLYAKYFYVLALYLISRVFALSYTSIHPLFVAMGYVRQNCIYTAISNVVYFIVAIVLIDCCGILGLVVALFVEYITIISLKQRAIKKKLLIA